MKDSKELLDNILKILDCKNDTELLKKLNEVGKVNQSQISRWRSGGLSKSTSILLERLINEFDI